MYQSHRRPNLSVDTAEARADAPPAVPGLSQRQAQGRHRHFHTSVFRSSQLEVQVHSPSIKSSHRNSYEPSKSLPVFGDHDTVEGAVILEPHLAVNPGRLTVTFEGAFIYLSPVIVDAHDEDRAAARGNSDKYRHLFFSSTTTFTTGETSSPRSATSLRDALANSVRSRKVDKSGASDLTATTRPHFPFSFEIPRPGRYGEELPPTCRTVTSNVVGIRGRSCVERAEVEYKIIARWVGMGEFNDRTQLEAPILFQPDTDFQSLDGLYLEPESWLEIPLRSDRTIPFKCAVTLPDPPTFPRSASIPFFVVFTTNPRSSTLAREIAADATIAVSLLRQVTVLSRPSPLYSPTVSSGSSSEDSDAPPPTPKRALLRRVTRSKSSMSLSSKAASDSRRPPKDKPLPPIPHGISDTRSLQTDVCVGFPKRPRSRPTTNDRHPSLEQAHALPDGLYKGKLKLEKAMLPSIDWAGLSVKYFVEVSVLFNQDELRARVPIRIF